MGKCALFKWLAWPEAVSSRCPFQLTLLDPSTLARPLRGAAVSAFANCGRAVAHVRGSYVPTTDSAAALLCYVLASHVRPGRSECLRSASTVQAHYGSEGIVDRMMRALAAAGHDVSKPTVEMLEPVDQLHVGGLNATKTQADLIAITDEMRVLDAGCGVGGSSRYLAHNYGCRVEAIDLTPQYVEAAAQLNKLCGMHDKITVRQGSVTELPYADRSFDLVWSQNVTMNVEDKRRMFFETFRVPRS